MSRLSSYQEDLVQPDRSILYKHNYLGLLKSVTRLCAPRTVSSGVYEPHVCLQIPKAYQEIPWSGFGVLPLASPIISTHLNALWVALFALSRVRNKATQHPLTGFPFPGRCGTLKLPKCVCLAALKIVCHRVRNLTLIVHVKKTM